MALKPENAGVFGLTGLLFAWTTGFRYMKISTPALQTRLSLTLPSYYSENKKAPKGPQMHAMSPPWEGLETSHPHASTTGAELQNNPTSDSGKS
jgi:hypothetical protein